MVLLKEESLGWSLHWMLLCVWNCNRNCFSITHDTLLFVTMIRMCGWLTRVPIGAKIPPCAILGPSRPGWLTGGAKAGKSRGWWMARWQRGWRWSQSGAKSPEKLWRLEWSLLRCDMSAGIDLEMWIISSRWWNSTFEVLNIEKVFSATYEIKFDGAARRKI